MIIYTRNNKKIFLKESDIKNIIMNSVNNLLTEAPFYRRKKQDPVYLQELKKKSRVENLGILQLREMENNIGYLVLPPYRYMYFVKMKMGYGIFLLVKEAKKCSMVVNGMLLLDS